MAEPAAAEKTLQALQELQALQAFHDAAVDQAQAAQKKLDDTGVAFIRVVQAVKLDDLYLGRAKGKGTPLSCMDLRVLILVTSLLQQQCDIAINAEYVPRTKFLLQLLLVTCPIKAINVFVGAGKQCQIATDAIQAITRNVANPDPDVVIKYVNALVKYAEQIGGVSAKYPVDIANAMFPNPIIYAAHLANIGTSYLQNSTPLATVVLFNLILARIAAKGVLFM